MIESDSTLKVKSKDTAAVKSSDKPKSASKKDEEPKEVKVKAAKTPKSDKIKKTSFADEEIVKEDSKKPKKKSKATEELCLFCEKSVEMTTEDALEQHYQKDCPYLVKCPQCEQIVEIILLQNHMYGSCEMAPSDPKSVITFSNHDSATDVIYLFHLLTLFLIDLKRNVKLGTLIMIPRFVGFVKSQSWVNLVGKFMF